jgi:hypothetical protein
MSEQLVRGVVLMILLVAAFVGGLAVGQRRSMDMLVPMMATEATASLAQRVETLARIRNGDYAGAIPMLEQSVNVATMNLPMGKPWTELDASARSALQQAKAYRSVYPPAPTDTTLVAFLETVPMPAAESCGPALRKLLADAAPK